MDFSYTETQDMLRDTLARFLADTYDFETRKKMLLRPEGRDPGIWKAISTELGLTCAPFAEEYGGMGGGPAWSAAAGSAQSAGAAASTSCACAARPMNKAPNRITIDRVVVLIAFTAPVVSAPTCNTFKAATCAVLSLATAALDKLLT